MASDRAWTSPLALRLAAGAALVALLAWLLLELLTHTHLYATAVLVAGAGLLVIQSLARSISRADSVMADVLDNLAAARTDTVLRPVRGFPALARAADAASARLRRESLQRQTERDVLKSLLDTAPTALLVLQADGGVELVNRAAFALAKGDVRRLADIPGFDGEAAQAVQALPPGGRAVIHAGGRKLFVSSSLLSLTGREPMVLIALQGVTEDLGVVEQQAWSELIRVLAHEMMNSLTPIASLSESLARRPTSGADPEAEAALRVIARRSENLMAFVDRYRAIAQVPQPVLRTIDLQALTNDIARLMAGNLAEASALFSVDVIPADLLVSADRGLLEQAVINLLKNALDATRACSPPVIGLSAQLREGRVVICLSDNGEGVAPEKAEDIFVPFFTSRAGGSGIGLSLARQIAVAHGGHLTVRANTPCGSIFEISLPGQSAV